MLAENVHFTELFIDKEHKKSLLNKCSCAAKPNGNMDRKISFLPNL